jgi:hypothetical protein
MRASRSHARSRRGSTRPQMPALVVSLSLGSSLHVLTKRHNIRRGSPRSRRRPKKGSASSPVRRPDQPRPSRSATGRGAAPATPPTPCASTAQRMRRARPGRPGSPSATRVAPTHVRNAFSRCASAPRRSAADQARMPTRPGVRTGSPAHASAAKNYGSRQCDASSRYSRRSAVSATDGASRSRRRFPTCRQATGPRSPINSRRSLRPDLITIAPCTEHRSGGVFVALSRITIPYRV